MDTYPLVLVLSSVESQEVAEKVVVVRQGVLVSMPFSISYLGKFLLKDNWFNFDLDT